MKKLFFLSGAVLIGIIIYWFCFHQSYPIKQVLKLANVMLQNVEACSDIIESTDEFVALKKSGFSPSEEGISTETFESLLNSVQNDPEVEMGDTLALGVVAEVFFAHVGLERMQAVLESKDIRKSIDEINMNIEEELRALTNPPKKYGKIHEFLVGFNALYIDYCSLTLNPLQEHKLVVYYAKYVKLKVLLMNSYPILINEITEEYKDKVEWTEEYSKALENLQRLKSEIEDIQ
jgi:hypothetical protein